MFGLSSVLNSMLRRSLLAAAILSGCAAPPPKNEKTVTAEMLKPLTEAYREYVAALVALDSPAPKEKSDALVRLQSTPYAYFPDDRELIKKAAAGEELAR